ncbi:MAG TPA: Fe-S cluster assembly protein SufD [Vicinamibacterales bacterium]|nr:Fe-S cluster assembly protein SufD [Vicinamibacterales bacterium]
MSQVAERHAPLALLFEGFRADAAFGPPDLAEVRQAAFARVLDRGFPTTRDEEWRFTNVAPALAPPYVRPAAGRPADAVIAPFRFGDAVPHEAVLVNGRLDAGLSSLDRLPAGVTVRSFAEAIAAGRVSIDECYSAVPPTIFAELNAALFEGGVVVEVAEGAVVAEPIHVLSVVTTGAAPVFVAPRLVVRIGEQAQASLVESHVSLGEGTALTVPVVDIRVAPGGVLRHVKLEYESAAVFHLAATTVDVARAAVHDSRAITLGGRLVRNDIVATLTGEGAECTLDGLYVADGDTLVDTHTTIDHAQAHCPSHEVYKGILTGRAQAVFNGKIIVRPDAQKTDAKQTNKALLLSDDARINTKPQLEIFADDVRCTHGAAIGQLDEDALFYLRARGVAAHDARNMLIHAFAGEVIDEITIPAVRETAMRLMEQKLSLGELA